MDSVSGALAGVRVLDITAAMPGAIATMLLADNGADVIRLDLAGSRGESAPQSLANTATWERGRRILRIEAGDASHQATVASLVASADVVIVDLEPAAARRLSLDAASVRSSNPDVVYTALTGFGLTDSRATPGIDVLVAAELGAVNVPISVRRDGPVFLGHPAIAYSTAFNALIGTLAALRARVTRGHGDLVDASMLDGVLAQFTMNWWTEKKISFLSERRSDGQLDLGRARMLVRSFDCSDGRRIQVHSGAAGAFGRLMKLLGLEQRISTATTAVESASPLTDADLAVLEELPRIFATRSCDEWLRDIWANEIAALPVLAPGEVFDDDQVRHLNLVYTLGSPTLGAIDVVASPLRLSESPGLTPSRDRDIGLAEARWIAQGLDRVAEPSPADGRGPLDGIRVLELSVFFAAPYAMRFLRDLGAEVIKIEALSGDPIRSLPDPFEGVARGKRSLAIDVKDKEARPWIERLIAASDIVQHNFRPGVAERLGVDAATARRLNPAVIYAYAPGFGSTGPKSMRQSFAPLHSGFVGIQTEAAGAGNIPTITFGNEDYYNGQLNAIGALLALVHRDRSGKGQDVECSQLASSVFVTSHWYRTADGARHSALPAALDENQLGWSPYQRLYQCLEGWLCVCCATPRQQAALRETVLGDANGDAQQCEDAFYGRDAAEWMGDLRAAGVPCTVVAAGMWLHDFVRDPQQAAAGRALRFDHPRAGAVAVIGRVVQLDSARPREPVRAPRLGEHSRAILRELGADAALIDRLCERGAVVSDAGVEGKSR